MIDPGTRPEGGDDAERYRDQDAEGEAGDGQLERGRGPLEEDPEGAVADDEGVAEVAADGARQEPAVLEQERIVEAERATQVGDRLPGGLRRQQHRRRIAGQVQEGEHHEGDGDAREDGVDETVGDVGGAGHAMPSPPS